MLRDLLKGSLDSLVFTLVQDLNQVHNCLVSTLARETQIRCLGSNLMRSIKLLLPLKKLITLLRETDELLVGLLIYMTILLQVFVDAMQQFQELEDD